MARSCYVTKSGTNRLEVYLNFMAKVSNRIENESDGCNG